MRDVDFIWEGYGRFIDQGGRAVHTTRHVPFERNWFGLVRWPRVLSLQVFRRGPVLFFDTGRKDYSGFRIYREAPVLPIGDW